MRLRRFPALLVGLVLLGACGEAGGVPDRSAAAVPTAVPVAAAGGTVVAAVGDLACDPDNPAFRGGRGTGGPGRDGLCRHAAVADTVAALKPAAFLPLGDLQYTDGRLAAFRASYDRSFGRFMSITRPVPGNHEYGVRGAAGYFDYFGAQAGPRGKGWYSYDVGRWHLVALNANCGPVACGPGSPQLAWLRADLAAHPARCTLAYWHQPRFSSGLHGDNRAGTTAFWTALYDAGVDVVLNGHDHHYERFAPLDPSGKADPGKGIRQFVVGSGGSQHYAVRRPRPGSQARDSSSYGVLGLTLRDGSYDWAFRPIAGGRYRDAGTATCH